MGNREVGGRQKVFFIHSALVPLTLRFISKVLVVLWELKIEIVYDL